KCNIQQYGGPEKPSTRANHRITLKMLLRAPPGNKAPVNGFPQYGAGQKHGGGDAMRRLARRPRAARNHVMAIVGVDRRTAVGPHSRSRQRRPGPGQAVAHALPYRPPNVRSCITLPFSSLTRNVPPEGTRT